MKLPFFLLALLLCPLSGPPARADTSSSHEQQNTQQYGNCTVSTHVDMFTDAEIHLLICSEFTLTDKTLISIRSDSEGLAVFLNRGLQVHMEWSIPVAIRIDKGPLIKRDAEWYPEDAERAAIFDQQLARSLLHDITHGQRVAIQVGNERGHVRLDGSRRAVEDFRRRAGLQPQQTLTISPTQP